MAQNDSSDKSTVTNGTVNRPTSTHVYEEADGSWSWEIWDFHAAVIAEGNEPTRAHALEMMFERFEYLQDQHVQNLHQSRERRS